MTAQVEERRSITTLFVDLSGFVFLSTGSHPDETGDLFNRQREIRGHRP